MRYIKPFLLAENVQSAKQLLKKLNIKEDDEAYSYIRKMLTGYDGYVYWFTKQRYENNASLSELKLIIDTIKEEKPIISLFSKPVIELNTTEEFWDEFDNAKIRQIAKIIYNKFPSTQKRLVDLNNKEEINLLKSLSEDEDNNSFLLKISSFRTKKDLFDAIKRFLTSKTDNNYDVLLNQVNDSGAKVVYKDSSSNIIIAQVNYKQICELGGDTAWCIVRSEYTFNSYNSTNFSKQFIIFLTDEVSTLSKIGVTTNINGFNTAHDKNDAYVSIDKLEDILVSRGTDISKLYVSKAEITYDLFDDVPSSVLLDIGYSKKEIIDNKTIFKNRYGNYSDLSIFTKEEIDKWKLLDRSELSMNDLKKYTIDEIVKKKLLSRIASDYSIEAIFDIGFELDDIIKYNKLFTKLNKLSVRILDLILRLKTREKLLRYIKLFFNDFDREDSPFARYIIGKIIRLNTDDVDLDDFIGINKVKYENLSFDKKILFLKDSGFEIDKDIVKKLVGTNIKNLCHSLNMIVSKNDEQLIFINDILISIINDTLDSSDIRYHMDYNYNDMEQIKTSIYSYYPELMEKIFDTCVSVLKRNTYYLRVMSDHSTNIKSTMKNIEYFGFLNSANYNIDSVTSLFSSEIPYYNIVEFITFLEKLGYVKNSDITYSAISTVSGRRGGTIEILVLCIENGIEVEKCYDKLIEYVKQKKSSISDYDMNKIKNILSKEDKYMSLIPDLEAENYRKEVVDNTLIATKYWSSNNGNALDPEKWYDKYFDDFKDIKISGYDSFRIGIGVLILLAKLGKTKDFDKVKFDILNESSNFGRSALFELCKVITNRNITNGDFTWRIKLDAEQRKSLFKWVSKKIDSKNYIQNYTMQVCYYLYDKKKFDEFMTVAEKVSNNCADYRSIILNNKLKRSTSKSSHTARILEVLPTIKYLSEMSKFTDVKKILTRVNNFDNMNDTERKLTIDILEYNSDMRYSKNKDDKDDAIRSEVRTLDSDNKKEFNSLSNKIFKVNESIVRFSDYF